MYPWVEFVRTCRKMITEGIIMFYGYRYNFVAYDCLYANGPLYWNLISSLMAGWKYLCVEIRYAKVLP
jgi:hypothetical protein